LPKGTRFASESLNADTDRESENWLKIKSSLPHQRERSRE
jgi:hypothetical protein